MYIVWAVAGCLLFALFASGSAVVACMALGALLGLVWARLSRVSRDLEHTRRQLDELIAHGVAERTPLASPKVVVAPPLPPSPPPSAAAERSDVASFDDAFRSPSLLESAAPAVKSAPARPPIAMPPFEPSTPDPVERTAARIKSWFTEGNVPVKIGMLVLFAGVAALLKYASDTGLLHLPIGLRVALVAAAAIAALAFGWRQRDVRRVFALSLQGGAIGVLLITVFASFRLYGLLPPVAAFALLIVLVAGVGALAVLQDALALAVLGLVAGFAAPILVSTGNGSQVTLFSYCALLNLAILGIAWKRSWRVLNLLGFVATFGIGTAWGVLKYEPALFAGTEPFLILNFFFYLAIPLLYLLRAPAERSWRIIDGCLLFGNPLISLLLQGALLHWQAKPLAISALAAAVIYLAVAWSIRRRDGLGVLRDAWAVLAIAFATLAVPLALSASFTSSVFALEGAGLIWLGLRQQRWLSRWGGIALQLFAAIALVISLLDTSFTGVAPWTDRDFIGLLLLAAGAFASSALYARLGSTTPQKLASFLLYAWGLCCWLGGTSVEIHRYLSGHDDAAASTLLFALTGWIAAEVARRVIRHALGRALACTAVLMFLLMLPLQFYWWPRNLLAVLVGAALGWRTLQCLRDRPLEGPLAQWLWLWRWMLLVVFAVHVSLAPRLQLSDSWVLLISVLPMTAVLWLGLTRPLWIAQPLPEHWPRLRAPLQYSVLIALGFLWIGALFMEGNAAPLRYLPLLNPTDLMLLIVLFCAVRWSGDGSTASAVRQQRPLVLGLLFMAFATSATLRAVHQLGGVPWDGALGDSSLAQMSLTVVWSVLGLMAWVWGSRRGQRVVWLAGAVTMAVVLAKLLLIDRGHLGNLFGIASFIAYGVLCTVIGYLAPAPPKHIDTEPREAADAP